MEFQSVLHSRVVGAAADYEAVLLPEVGLVGQGGLALVEHVFNSSLADFHESFGYLLAVDVHAHAVCLHHGSLAVAVHHESRQVVAFAVYEAEGVVL